MAAGSKEERASESAADPAESFLAFRKSGLAQFVSAWSGLGQLPFVVLIFFPRLCLSMLVVAAGQLCRGVAKILDTSSSYQRKANLRILIVTDYMPPQTHGIAIRFRQYIDCMRKLGHEVHVFSTNITKERETSFDNPNLPSIVNPFNVHNKMSYNTGVKLAWYLGAKQWDIVHLVYPSNIALCVLPVCAWRRIPMYCSHHVDMEYYVGQYVRLAWLANIGFMLYYILIKLPAMSLANVNAAPTLCFLESHMPSCGGARRRIPSGVADARFKVDGAEQLERERAELLAKIGQSPKGGGKMMVWLMVQRLAPEKCTDHALQALRRLPIENGARVVQTDEGKLPVHLVVAGDGPARKSLEAYAEKSNPPLPVTFLGNLPNTQLPPLYRAADVFLTCSTSETCARPPRRPPGAHPAPARRPLVPSRRSSPPPAPRSRQVRSHGARGSRVRHARRAPSLRRLRRVMGREAARRLAVRGAR